MTGTPKPNALIVPLRPGHATCLIMCQRLFRLKQLLADSTRHGDRPGEYRAANKLTTLRHQAAKAGQSGICIAASRLIAQVHRRPGTPPTTPDTAA